MSTTEGLWSGKLFKIKLDSKDLIIGCEKNLENGWEGENKKIRNGDDKHKKSESQNRIGINDNNQELGYGGNKEVGKERRDLRMDFGVGEINQGSETTTKKPDSDNNNNN